MTSPTPKLLVRFLAATAVAVAVFAGPSPPAMAGGWAIGSLDSIPVATVGQTTDIGFTILQHGIHPADIHDDVGIEIRHPDGSDTFFPAVSDGTPGRYIATVTFPESSGSYPWSIRMGWFGPHELGTLDVRPAEAASASLRPTIQWLALGGSLLLAGSAIADAAVSRRRRPVVLG
jgi:hypothetical protein